MESELRQKIGQDLSTKYQRRFERKLDEELRKIDRSNENWRIKVELKERKSQELTVALAHCRDECSRICAASQKKDAAAAELALLVSEKDMLLTELALLSRAQKREIVRLSRGVQACKISEVGARPTNERVKIVRTQLKEALFITCEASC